jgi:hypothetical protein
MGPRHNITHTKGPSDDDLKHVIEQSKPLVIEHTNATGQVYYPVFLPFNARIVCPYCRKECSIGTYPSHVKGDRRCHEHRRLEDQGKIVPQATQVTPATVLNASQVDNSQSAISLPITHVTNQTLLPPLVDAKTLTPENQAMFAMFLQFNEFIKNNKTTKISSRTDEKDNPGKSRYH